MHLRIARHTEQLDELVAFYRDGLGLELIGAFNEHDGYSGRFLAVPGTAAHLEFTSGPAATAPAPHPESLTVLYLADTAAVGAAVDRCAATLVETDNPYWQRVGAVAVRDPDGFLVVLVPGPSTEPPDPAAQPPGGHPGGFPDGSSLVQPR